MQTPQTYLVANWTGISFILQVRAMHLKCSKKILLGDALFAEL